MKLETLETEVFCGLGNTRHRMQVFHWEVERKKDLHAAKYIALLSILFIFFSTNAILLGQRVKFVEKGEISPETVLPLNVKAFYVTEDELFIIPEHKTNNILFREYAAKIIKTNMENKIGGKKTSKNELFCKKLALVMK